MVLKNSKYDKQAKKKYMAKHGLLPKPSAEPRAVRPKWSSKKKNNSQDTMKLDIDEMTSDWDSDVDEDIVNYFYPQLGEELDQIPMDQKRRIKRQIIEDLKGQRDEIMNKSDEEEEEPDGIYLGTKSPETAPVTLNEFLPEIPVAKKHLNRKLPKAEQSGDLLEEYGLENYKETVRTKDDYDALYKKKLESRNLNEILADELVGFRIGKDSLGDRRQNKTGEIRTLTEEEIEQERARRVKEDQNKFYTQMKHKFNSKHPEPSGKVLELNNYNSENQSHLDYLNNKIINQGVLGSESRDLDDDLNDLLGERLGNVTLEKSEEPDIDELLKEWPATAKGPTKDPATVKEPVKEPVTVQGEVPTHKEVPTPSDQDFLDDLLL